MEGLSSDLRLRDFNSDLDLDDLDFRLDDGGDRSSSSSADVE